MNVLAYDLDLQALKERSVDRLMTAEVFDRSAFEQLLACLDGKAVALRQEHVVPKQVLACLREAAEVINSRAAHLPEVRAHSDLAGRFTLLLDLIIRGESLADRAPGVPRII